MLLFTQANDVFLDACISNFSAHRADHPLVLFDAHLHDLQRVAMSRRGVWRCNWLFSFWLEKICGRGCHGTLPLAKIEIQNCLAGFCDILFCQLSPNYEITRKNCLFLLGKTDLLFRKYYNRGTNLGVF